MSRKTWIMLKRGLVDDPKHRAAMGIRIWLFFHVLDRANWPDGVVYDWKDAAEAEAMKMPLATVRLQRRELEEAGYIKAIHKGDHLDVQILKWVNPREYSGKVYNWPDMGGAEEEESDSSIGRKLSLSESGGGESDSESDSKSGSESDRSIGNRPASESAPSISSQIRSHKSDVMDSKSQDPWVQVLIGLKHEMTNRGMVAPEYKRYLEPTWLKSIDAGVATVICEGENAEYQVAWLTDRLAKSCARHLMCDEVRFVVAADVAA